MSETCICNKRFERPATLPTRTIKKEFGCEDLPPGKLRDFFLRISPRPDTGESVESFVTVDESGRCKPALMSGINRLISLALQWGIPPERVARTLCGIQCPASIAGEPLSCLDWMGDEIKELEPPVVRRDGKCRNGLYFKNEKAK